MSYLISRPSSLTTDVAQGFSAFTLKTDLGGLDGGAETRLGSELHAKVFAFDQAEQATLILGSANATGAAFTMNDEVMVRLTGHVRTIGVEALLGTTTEELATTDDLELIDMLEPFVPGAVDEETGEDDGRWFDAAINIVASISIAGSCAETSPEQWKTTLQLTTPVGDLGTVRVEFSLLGQWSVLPSSFAMGQPAAVETGLEELTRFIVARFSDPSSRQEAVSVVLVADLAMPDGRARRALRALLTNRERFARFLRYLLEGSVEPGFGDGEEGDDIGARRQRRRANAGVLDEGPILERVLRLLATNPAELRGLDQVIAEFAGDDDLLPEGFADLWKAIAPLIPAVRA